MKRFRPTKFQLLVVVVMLFALVEIVVIAGLLFKSYVSPPPLAYDKVSYEPDGGQHVFCPGDTLRFTPTLLVQQSGQIRVVRQFWDVQDERYATLRDGSPAPTTDYIRVLPPSIVGKARGSQIPIVIPDLAPGAYWLLSATSAPDAGQGTYIVPFVVKEGCAAASKGT